MAGQQRTPLAERFARFVRPLNADQCWLWRGSMNGRYGQIGAGGRDRPLLAHRAAWTIANGPIPDGLFVLHRCDNGRCVNPAHLFVGTQRENMHDMIAKGRHVTGERHWKARLTRADVRDIRDSRETGRALAKRFNVPFQTISSVRCRKSWKHVL